MRGYRCSSAPPASLRLMCTPARRTPSPILPRTSSLRQMPAAVWHHVAVAPGDDVGVSIRRAHHAPRRARTYGRRQTVRSPRRPDPTGEIFGRDGWLSRPHAGKEKCSGRLGPAAPTKSNCLVGSGGLSEPYGFSRSASGDRSLQRPTDTSRRPPDRTPKE